MTAEFREGELTLTPQSDEETIFINVLATQISFDENPTKVTRPVEVRVSGTHLVLRRKPS